jgi:hypothetical protein
VAQLAVGEIEKPHEVDLAVAQVEGTGPGDTRGQGLPLGPVVQLAGTEVCPAMVIR